MASWHYLDTWEMISWCIKAQQSYSRCDTLQSMVWYDWSGYVRNLSLYSSWEVGNSEGSIHTKSYYLWYGTLQKSIFHLALTGCTKHGAYYVSNSFKLSLAHLKIVLCPYRILMVNSYPIHTNLKWMHIIIHFLHESHEVMKVRKYVLFIQS